MATITKLNTIEGEQATEILSGNMYYFRYLAEPTNPYYDRFPLVFIIRKRERLLEGVNFHYMQLQYRTELLDNMTPFFDETTLSSDTRLKVKTFRNLILDSRKFRFAKAAIHRYRMENIRSKIIKISPLSWNTAILQEAEKFVSSSGGTMKSQSIFKETLLKVRGRK